MTSVRQLIAGALPFGGLSADTLDRVVVSVEEIALVSDSVVYEAGTRSDDLYFVASGAVRLEQVEYRVGRKPTRVARPGDAFGWTAFADNAQRRYRALAISPTTLLRVSGTHLIELVAADPSAGPTLQNDIAGAIHAIQQPARSGDQGRNGVLANLALSRYRIGRWVNSPAPYLALLGYALVLGFWYVSVERLKLPRFAEMPGLTAVFHEWVSADPTYGVSIHTSVYYLHILVSLRRIGIAFAFATLLGVPVGLLLGWSRSFRNYVFPIFELVRPIPILAWVPLAIVMLPGSELPVLYLTFLASFFATALNTMLGVKSIDRVYVLAAECLGASPFQIFRHIIVPGALPFIFTGLQISVGVAWFSLVAAEMVSGQFGLGYLINTSYTTVQYPTIIIAMITLGVVGYASSALVRIAGDWLMVWRVRQLSMDRAS
jgi:ABC-type nitrate/sulfonate/bicarbonate transport system permease component